MKNGLFGVAKTAAHATIAPLLWATRAIGPGSPHGWVPRGQRLSASQLGQHASVRTTTFYSAGDCDFGPLHLDGAHRADVSRSIVAHAGTFQRSAGLACAIPHGRIIHSDYVLTPEDDFFPDLRFPRIYMPNISGMRALRIPRFGKPTKFKGTALVLSSIPNLYHCLFDSIGRLSMASAAGFPAEAFDFFLTSRLSAPFEREILLQSGVREDRIMDFSRHLEFDRVIFSPLPLGISAELCALVRSQCRSIRTTRTTPLPKRIYLTRGPKTKSRSIVNETEVIELLREFNVSVFIPHEHDVATQRAIIENCDLIVSAHGAALANLIWARPGTRVIELRSKRHAGGYWNLYWNISSVLQLQHTWVCCNTNANERTPPRAFGQYDDLLVPIVELRKALAGELGAFDPRPLLASSD